MPDVDFLLHFDHRGRSADVDRDRHIRNMIEQILFTSPGERVNRPTFGSGLNQLVFSPNSDQLATASQALVQAALNEWLGDLIQVEEVQVENDDAKLVVNVQYVVIRNRQRRVDRFSRSGGAPT